MPNETGPPNNGTKDIRIPLPGLVDRAIVALVGAILGIGGSFTVQKMEPRARADPFAASDHKPWEEEIRRQAIEISKIQAQLRELEFECKDRDSDIKAIQSYMIEWAAERKETSERIGEIWRDLFRHTHSRHPPESVEKQINSNSTQSERNRERIEQLEKKGRGK